MPSMRVKGAKTRQLSVYAWLSKDDAALIPCALRDRSAHHKPCWRIAGHQVITACLNVFSRELRATFALRIRP